MQWDVLTQANLSFEQLCASSVQFRSLSDERASFKKALAKVNESAQSANVVSIQDTFKRLFRVHVAFKHVFSSVNCPSHRFLP